MLFQRYNGRRLVWSLRKHQFSKFVHKSSKDSFASLHLKQSLSNPRSLKSSIPNTSPEQTRRSSSREKEEEKAIESPSQVWRHREKLNTKLFLLLPPPLQRRSLWTCGCGGSKLVAIKAISSFSLMQHNVRINYFHFIT